MLIQMFAPNVGQASRAGRTEKKKKNYTTPLDLYTIASNSIKKAILMIKPTTKPERTHQVKYKVLFFIKIAFLMLFHAIV